MTALTEEVGFFACGPLDLAGVVTVPATPCGRGVMLPWGSGGTPSSGRNRIRARLARALAAEGYHTLRFDYCGVGESGGSPTPPDLAMPKVDEIVAAERILVEYGIRRVAVVANCFGAWSALAAADRLAHLDAVALIGPPVYRNHAQVKAARLPAWRRAGRRIARRSGTRRPTVARDTFERSVRALVDREVSVLLVHGVDDFHDDLEAVLDGGLRGVLSNALPTTRIVATDHRVQGPPHLAAQEFLVDTVMGWFADLADVDGQ